MWSASWALKWSCLPLSPIVSGCLPSCGGWVLVGVVGFLGSEVILSPVVSGCLPSCGGWGVVGVAAILGSEVVLSPVVSGCLPSCGGWVLVGVVGFLGSAVVLSPVVSGCLRLSPFMWGGCWLVWSASWALKWSCPPLSPIVSGCLPSCGGRVLVGVAASRTETFRDQNHRLQSKFAYCKLFGAYAGVILSHRNCEKRTFLIYIYFFRFVENNSYKLLECSLLSLEHKEVKGNHCDDLPAFLLILSPCSLSTLISSYFAPFCHGMFTRWWFQIFSIFTPTWRDDPI